MKRLSLAAALVASLTPAIAADTISATHVFPASLIYSRSFLEYVKKANEAGKGVFAIQVRGGPEAIPMMQQPGAVRDGAVDMVYTACAFYAAQVPECDAMSASTLDGPTARKNGGTDFLNQIHQKRAGVVMLGWVDSGIRFTMCST
jgi:TRAP-type C4-dicarboxylate transport system substrate-binding protein